MRASSASPAIPRSNPGVLWLSGIQRAREWPPSSTRRGDGNGRDRSPPSARPVRRRSPCINLEDHIGTRPRLRRAPPRHIATAAASTAAGHQQREGVGDGHRPRRQAHTIGDPQGESGDGDQIGADRYPLDLVGRTILRICGAKLTTEQAAAAVPTRWSECQHSVHLGPLSLAAARQRRRPSAPVPLATAARTGLGGSRRTEVERRGAPNGGPSFVGALLFALVLQDAFEVMLLPRRVNRRWRLTRYYFRGSWRLWRAAARLWPAGERRERFLSIFGSLAMTLLFSLWAVALIVAFGLLQWAAQTWAPVQGGVGPRRRDLLQRRHLLHPGLWRSRPAHRLGAGAGGVRGGRRFRADRRGHRLPAGALPAVLESRGARAAARRARRLAAERRHPAVPARRIVAASTASTRFCASGRSGARSCSKAISPTRCSPTTARSTRTSHGSPR